MGDQGQDPDDAAANHGHPVEDAAYRNLETVYAAFTTVGSIGVPTVAAVRGAVVGAGLNRALASDLRVVPRSARLLPGFPQIGIHPGGGHFTPAQPACRARGRCRPRALRSGDRRRTSGSARTRLGGIRRRRRRAGGPGAGHACREGSRLGSPGCRELSPRDGPGGEWPGMSPSSWRAPRRCGTYAGSIPRNPAVAVSARPGPSSLNSRIAADGATATCCAPGRAVGLHCP
jgi:hypothetical protein